MPSYLSYKRQMAVLDVDDNEIESWITVRGNHIPIRKGQSKEDAVKSFIAGKKKNLVENHNSLVEAMNLEEKGYFKKDPKKRDSITQSAIEMGKEEKNLEELMEFGVKEGNAAKPESKNGTYTYKKGEEVEFYTDVMHDDLAKGKIVGFERSMASHGNKAENQYIIKMPDGSTRTINEKQIDWAKEKSKTESKKGGSDLHKEYEKAKNELNRQEDLYRQGRTTEYQVNEARNKELELKGKIQKEAKSKSKKEPAIVREGNVNWVDPKVWNSPASDPWYALYN